MKITKVGIEYSETHSEVTYGVILEAEVAGENPYRVRQDLRKIAITEVKELFGELRQQDDVRITRDRLDAIRSVAKGLDAAMGPWAGKFIREKVATLRELLDISDLPF